LKRLIFWFLNVIIRLGTSILCRIERAPLKQVPKHGPLILAVNHIGSLEVPLLFAWLQPRQLTGLAKIETWDSKFMGWLFDLWEAIPVRRGEADLEAIRRSLAVLEAGEILAVAPEGTRSGNGQLQHAQAGIAFLALRSCVPILPMAHWGGESFSANFKLRKRTDFHVRVGKQFTLDPGGEKVTAEVRQAMADEVMYQISALMPEPYRGEYADLSRATTKYLRFDDDIL
jgi:1-acyl-sn-glycerol-3-phosphate acyltransferase